MKIFGKYLNKNEFLDCNFIIKNGKIYTFEVDNKINVNVSLLNRNHSSDYELEENIQSKSDEHNYILKFYGGSEKPSLIYLKLNWFKLVCLKYSMRKWLIQSDDIKKDILKYVIGAVLGSFITLISQEVSHVTKREPHKAPKNVSQKSLDNK
jgi:hypothetical protein